MGRVHRNQLIIKAICVEINKHFTWFKRLNHRLLKLSWVLMCKKTNLCRALAIMAKILNYLSYISEGSAIKNVFKKRIKSLTWSLSFGLTFSAFSSYYYNGTTFEVTEG